MDYTIRFIKKDEVDFLSEMLYEAIFVAPGKEKPPFSIIEEPSIAKYITEFGREGDLCLVAEVKGKLIGAAWARLFSANSPSYGFIDENTPEISIALKPEFRGKGIGTELIESLLQQIKLKKFKQVSLSVDIINPAYRLYKKLGFKEVKTVDDSATMVKSLH